MTEKDILKFRNKALSLIDTRRISDAITEIDRVASANSIWAVKDRLDQVRMSYAYLLQYISQGVQDPQRDKVYDGIVADLYQLVDVLVRSLQITDNPSLYYSIVRTKQIGHDRPITSLLDNYRRLSADQSIFTLVSSEESKKQSTTARKNIEALQAEIFKSVWTTFPLSQTDADAIDAVIKDDTLSTDFKIHLMSALMLGMMQFFDRRRLQLMIDAYSDSEDMRLSSVALVGVLLSLWKNRHRPLSVANAERLTIIKERPQWTSDLRTAFIELIRARDTERINRKMQDEVIPSMMNMSPEILNKINDGSIDPNDMESLYQNPEWQDMLNKSGVADRLKELTEIQEQGGDVLMATFRHLKQFPFFNEISNWFLPFDPDNSSLPETDGALAETLAAAPFMCDSDKYSFMLALTMVPPSQRQMMSSQLQMQSDASAEMMLNTPDRRLSVNQYIQSIYRFFKLYSRKDEFFDPFSDGINLIAVDVLAGDFTDADLLEVVAEFYFKLGYWSDALDVFNKLEQIYPGDAPRYQKMGYCSEKTGDVDSAIEYYKRAELLDNRSVWNLQRIAACYRAKGKYNEAIGYYRQLTDNDPSNTSLILAYGQLLIQAEDYQGAAQELYKAEYMGNNKALRPLAWALLLSRDYPSAEKYYHRILTEETPTANDYLNMGHAALATGNLRDAINYYRLSVTNDDYESFRRSLESDRNSMVTAGIDLSLIPIIADAVTNSKL